MIRNCYLTLALIEAALLGMVFQTFANAGPPVRDGEIVTGKIHNISGEEVTILKNNGKTVKVARSKIGRRVFHPGDKVVIYLPPSDSSPSR